MIRRLAAALVLLAATLAAAEPAPTPALTDVQKNLEKAREEKGSLEREKSSLVGELDRLDREIDASRAALATLAAQEASARAKEASARGQVTSLDRELPRLRGLVRERAGGLLRLQRRGLGPVLVAFPGDLGEGLRLRRYVSSILERDGELLRELAKNRERAAAETKRAEDATREAARLAGEAKTKRAALEAERKEKNQRVASLGTAGQERERAIAELETMARRLEALLAKEREKAEEEERRVARAAPSTAAPPAAPVPAATRFGPPLQPMPAKIVSARNGIEIASTRGAPILAIADGRVVYSGWFPGYGKLVVLDHGGHLHSIYGFADDLLVGPGVRVTRGAPIGKVGSTGTAGGPTLYLEIRRRGEPEDARGFVGAAGRGREKTRDE